MSSLLIFGHICARRVQLSFLLTLVFWISKLELTFGRRIKWTEDLLKNYLVKLTLWKFGNSFVHVVVLPNGFNVTLTERYFIYIQFKHIFYKIHHSIGLESDTIAYSLIDYPPSYMYHTIPYHSIAWNMI